MRALELDYRRVGRRPRLLGCLLALAALAFAVDAGLFYQRLRVDIAAKEVALARDPMRRISRPAPTQALDFDEYAFARDTISRIATPWDSFFDALEEAQNERVSLLSIEPDVENRTVNLSGEAKDYLAALTYLAQLADQDRLARVHLVRHELRRTGSQRPVAFTISAAWKENP